MGLDGVELIMAVEDEFQIAIPNRDAEQSVTVGKLVDVVYERLRHTGTAACPSQHGFYVVRKTLTGTLGLKRSQIRPDTALEELIPRPGRNEVWRTVMTSLPTSNDVVTTLVRPKRLVLFAFLILPVLTTAVYVLFGREPELFALPVGILTGILGAMLTFPFKQEFPNGLRQVKDLVPFVTTLDTSARTREDVFQRVRKITSEQLGVNESKITLETDFVKDLRI